ncbi:alpha/beta fold hydrolase [Nocardia sp. R6R-6]|uniref:alpha/beta fold hydrolase n=1 Tax=Nocardia sp. R6R-6 TaxID=3459303 RepID=UPI00403DFF73
MTVTTEHALAVESSDGTTLHVRCYGEPDARPVVFLHGLGMDGLVWLHQIGALRRDYRGVAVDLRGHGRSGAPADESYSDADQWADDLHAVLGRFDRPPVVVGWSYAGMMVGDFLRKYGEDRLAGVYLVAPLRKVGTAEGVDLLDAAFLELVPGLLSHDLETSVSATERFLDLVTAHPLADRARYERLGAALSVPAEVRSAMLAREQDNDDVWRELTIPLGLGYGTDDRVIKDISARGLAQIAPTTQVDEHAGAGHAVFLDSAEKFAADLDRFLGTI